MRPAAADTHVVPVRLDKVGCAQPMHVQRLVVGVVDELRSKVYDKVMIPGEEAGGRRGSCLRGVRERGRGT